MLDDNVGSPRDDYGKDLTFNGLSANEFLMEYGYLPQHKGVVADQHAPKTIAEGDPEGYARFLASLANVGSPRGEEEGGPAVLRPAVMRPARRRSRSEHQQHGDKPC